MKRQSFQNGSVVLTKRKRSPDVWVFRYRGKGKQPAVRLGDITQLPTKAAAEMKAMELRPSINEYRRCHTVADLCDRFLKDGVPERESTARSYRSMLVPVREAFGPVGLEKFTSDLGAIETWLNDLRLTTNTAVGLSKKTKAHLKAFVHRLIECSMRWGYLKVQRNPVALVEIKGRQKRVRPVTIINVEAYHQILNELKDSPHVQVMVQIAMCLGLRVSEILGLRWEDINLERRFIHVQRSVVGMVEGDTKTIASDEYLPLHESLVSVLESWGATGSINGWLFGSSSTGRPYHASGLQKDHLKPAGKRVGLAHLGWHDLRHTYRALLRQLDLPLEVQQKLMRHSDISMTTKYGGIAPVELLRPANARVVELVEWRKVS